MSGILNFFAYTFGYVLNFIYNFVGSYGWAIIIFTILLKILMVPMTIKQQKSMKKNAKIQALAKEIQDKYSNDKLRMNQELTELYKNEKMSLGCFSSIFQILVILSIFFLVSKPLTYMKQIDAEVINEYTTKVQEESESEVRYTEIAIINNYSSENEDLKINMSFLGLDLSDIPTENLGDIKVYIIPTLYVITSILSMKLTTKATNNLNKKDNNKKLLEEKENKKEDKKEEMTQEEMMADMSKNMTYIMPFMTVSIALMAPLGLALYWFVSNLLTIAERQVIDKLIKEEE